MNYAASLNILDESYLIMATLSELQTAIDNLLSKPSISRIWRINSTRLDAAYEVYILGLCMEAVRRCNNGEATLVGINSGPYPPQVVFRGGPGSMASRGQDFCYVQCKVGSEEFEIHLDVEYEGSSGATHEVDVSIYSAESADFVRRTGRTPKTGRSLVMIFECKFYDSSVPGIGLARTLVGLKSDCSSQRLVGFVSNRATANLRKFLTKSSSPEPYTNVTPLDPDNEERFINDIKQELLKWTGTG